MSTSTPIEMGSQDLPAAGVVYRGRARQSIGTPAAVLALTLWSSVFQFYIIPVGDFYLSITLFASFMLLPFQYKAIFRLTPFPPILFLCGLIAAYIISLAWSVDVLAGVKIVVYTLPFITVFYASYLLSIRKPAQFRIIIHWFFLITLVQAFLAIGFRIAPSIKDSFVSSRLATPFLGENVQESIDSGDQHVNIADPDKSGGLFVNANVAAAYMGISALLAWGFGHIARKPYLKITAIILGVAVLFTGSKAGILLAMLLGSASFFVEGLLARLNFRFALSIVALSVVAIFLFIYLPNWESHTRLSGFFSDAGDTTSSRSMIWSFAATQFVKHPLKGLGFGGWEEAFYYPSISLGFRNVLPCHNTFIQVWANSGVAATLFELGFALSAIAIGARCLFMSDRNLIAQAIYTLAAFLWLILHGLGENFGPVGEMHMLPILAASLGSLYASYDTLVAANNENDQ